MTIRIPHLGALAAAKPENETKRLRELRALEILDTVEEERFDRLTELVARVLKTPMAGITFVDEERLWFKSSFGFSRRETPRELGFCQYTILEQDMMVVEDATADGRFVDHPMVRDDPGLRFYAGAIVRSPSGQAVGTCCALGTAPRKFSEEDREFLRLMARMVESELARRDEFETLRHQMMVTADATTESGLPDLYTFRSRVEAEIQRARKNRQMLLLASAQIKGFDAYEAALGREGATYLTGILARRFGESLDSPSTMALIREDEVAILTDLPDMGAAQSIISRLAACAYTPLAVAEHRVPVILRVGASIFPTHADDASSLIKRARTALWSLPKAEKSSFRLYRRRMSDLASVEFRIASALQDALDKEEFSLAFQPKMDLNRMVPAGAEALIRWSSGTLGDVPPDKFIPIAEKTLKIVDIGNWVIRAACAQLAPDGNLRPQMPEISVNVTAYQLSRKEFPDFVSRVLDKYSVPGRYLNVEITESTVIQDIENAIRALRRLREHGVKISIDDFGKGFSSLSYLTRLPIQVLKIDRSFIKNVMTHKESRKIVRSIVSMGHDLELEVVAEGVESMEQLDFLRSIECDQAQGFLFSPAMPPPELLIFLNKPPAFPSDRIDGGLGSKR